MKEQAGHPRVKQKPFEFHHQAAITLPSTNTPEKSRYDAGQCQPPLTPQGAKLGHQGCLALGQDGRLFTHAWISHWMWATLGRG